MFYSNDNARRLDFYVQELQELPTEMRRLLLGPLLSKASIHANTGGVFKGFYKDKHTGIGKLEPLQATQLAGFSLRLNSKCPL